MKVLVTGADGFIGSHLAERLCRDGHEVTALVQYNSFNGRGWLDGSPLGDRMRVLGADVRDPFLCRSACRGQEIVYHLAALIAIPFSYVAPQSYVETNVTGTLNLCQAALEAGVSRFVQMSTSEVYGTARYVPIDEDHPLQAQSPYSASKIAADAIATSHAAAFDLPVAIARPFNTYGPRQSARAVIPNIVAQIASGAESVRLGATSPTRDFTFVEDTCEALIALAASEAALGRVTNIGSNREISVADLFARIARIMGSSATIEADPQRDRPAASEVFRLRCDNTRLVETMGAFPAHSLERGLEKTVAWFREPENLARYRPDVYNV